MKTMGQLLRERRETIGFSNQQDFASALGRPAGWVSRIEKDRRVAPPTPEELRLIAAIIPITVTEMLAAMGYDVETGHEDDGPAIVALRPILESRNFTEKQIHQLATIVHGIVEMMEG